MQYKFERLEVWQRAVEYIDVIYSIADRLPISERFNLASQIKRAATSIALNIAEGSIGQTDPEQARFLNIARRSAVETVACILLIKRRKYLDDSSELDNAYAMSATLSRKLQAMRKAVLSTASIARDGASEFEVSDISEANDEIFE